MKYNTKYFIKKFEAIPESKWTTNSYKEGNQCCALGHCGMRGFGNHTKEAAALKLTFFNYPTGIVQVNDGVGENVLSLGETPKERVLNALYLINALEEEGDSFPPITTY